MRGKNSTTISEGAVIPVAYKTFITDSTTVLLPYYSHPPPFTCLLLPALLPVIADIGFYPELKYPDQASNSQALNMTTMIMYYTVSRGWKNKDWLLFRCENSRPLT